MKLKNIFIFAISVWSFFVTTGASADSRLPKENIIQILQGEGRFKTLLAAIDLVGLTPFLEKTEFPGVLAPTDAAFEKLPEGVLQGLLADIPALTNLIKYHVLKVQVTFAFVPWGCHGPCDLGSYETLNGQKQAVRYDGHSLFLNGDEAKILNWDIRAYNGRIYSIDSVLIPK